jgi:hypothetical protein
LGKNAATTEEIEALLRTGLAPIQSELARLQTELAPIKSELVRLQTELAPIKRALDHVMLQALDPWEKIHTERESVVSNAEKTNLQNVSTFYNTSMSYYCMMLGNIKNVHIICAHIWPECTHGEGLETLGLQANDISNPRNFLRLEKSIERAFDRKHLMLTPQFSVPGTFKLRLTVLNPELLESNLTDNDGNVVTTFAAINNAESNHTFDEHKRPFLRLLARHKLVSLRKARKLGWIEETAYSAERNCAIECARISLSDGENGSVIMKAFYDDV